VSQITVLYTSIDNCRSRRKFKTLAGARKFAQTCIGENPEIGRGYAVSGDGIGKIQVAGVTLDALFPGTSGPTEAEIEQAEIDAERAHRRMLEGRDEPEIYDTNTPAGRRGYLPEQMTPEEKLAAIRGLPYLGADGRLKMTLWYAANGVCEVDFADGAIAF